MLSEFGPGTDLAKRLRKLEDNVSNLSTRDVLQNASIDAGGITVDGGEIHVINGGSIVVDGSGTITLPSGAFSSGSVTTSALTVNGNSSVTGTETVSGQLNAQGGVAATGNVSASGQVSSNGSPFLSLPSYNYQVTTAYKAVWINGDGQIGYSASTRAVKKDLQPFPDDLTKAFLNLTPYLGRYTWDDESAPLKVFLIAEDVEAAGFGPDVVPTDANGVPESVNYSQVVVPLLAAVKSLQAQVTTLQNRLAAAGIA